MRTKGSAACMMKKNWKRIAGILLAVLLLAALTACESKPSNDVTFKNSLSSAIHSVYISPSTDEDWTDPLNYAVLSKGSSITIDFSKFAGNSPIYDIGVVDENAMNYDVYEIPLAIGDTLILSGDANGATLTVRGTDGKEASYEAYIYEN